MVGDSQTETEGFVGLYWCHRQQSGYRTRGLVPDIKQSPRLPRLSYYSASIS